MLFLVASPASAQQQRFDVRIDGLACPFCAHGIQREVEELPAVRDVELDLETARLTFRVERGRTVTPAAVFRAVDEAGFSVRTLRMTTTGVLRIDGPHPVLALGDVRLRLRGGSAEDRARRLAGRMELVLGSQGGWMVTPVVRLDADVGGAGCIETTLKARVEGGPPIAPLSVSSLYEAHGGALYGGPFLLLLSNDPAEGEGRVRRLDASVTGREMFGHRSVALTPVDQR